MHIEPGLVTGAKLALGAATAAGSATVALRLSWEDLRRRGLFSLAARAGLATAATLVFFELLPSQPVGVSEVHLILGSALFLILGAAPAALGLALGLLLQGLLFEPADLPQYGMNVTTLLVPLFALAWVAGRTIPAGTRYADLRYGDVLKLSATYQGGVVAWVAFWAFWGQGAEVAGAVATFAAAYLVVVLIEPVVDLALLWGARRLRGLEGSGLVTPRLLGA
ncbi:energy-coupling factor ABC transporter permease [Rubellimicrobium sp. CFH 75288]|uniref:energy-coupling factor ABC transporter permease n=1 Tax=Rubellimicrobium sp. CFH 75288 TaxID=2697034 RepID=UPI0014126CD7|nr:energy-coupling factor ABC transporter permease [Rubellimicrobium sp. CFH 75288]NAZ37621.1 cobalt transporter [Rubellimicrobium sp. CFH 75288]